jgi:hypothetical protein
MDAAWKQGLAGTAIGGLSGGIAAAAKDRNFWTGQHILKSRPQVYRSPIGNNLGNQNGECALRCFEEFSESYGMNQYDFDYWLEQNDYKLGVHARKIEGMIDNTGVFSSDPIVPQTDINTLAEAFKNDKRILMGFKTNSGGEHAVMIRKLKIWSDGSYRIWFAETSQVRLAPYSSSNLFEILGPGFWTFFPN